MGIIPTGSICLSQFLHPLYEKDIIIAKKFLPIQIGIVKNVDFSGRIEFLTQKSADCLALGHGLGGASLILDYENIKWAHKVSHWSMH